MSESGDILFRLMQILDDHNVPGESVVHQIENLIKDNLSLEKQIAREQREAASEKLLHALESDQSWIMTALVDACIEEDRQDEAKGWAWLSSNRKWPAKEIGGYFWYCEKPHGGIATLPRDLWYALPATEYRRYSHPRAALEAVVAAIAGGRWNPDTVQHTNGGSRTSRVSQSTILEVIADGDFQPYD